MFFDGEEVRKDLSRSDGGSDTSPRSPISIGISPDVSTFSSWAGFGRWGLPISSGASTASSSSSASAGTCTGCSAPTQKGMKQKVLLSASLLHDPEVLVFDEPLSGLDVTAALVFRSLVARLAERGKVVLFSSHVLDAIEKTCSTVVILSRGRVVAHDTVARLKELRRSPTLEHVFTELAVAEDPARTADAILDVVSPRRP